MAGDWIKFEHATPDKPEVVRLATILGIDHDAVVGKLIRMWIWADQQSEDGNAVSVTFSFLDRITFQPGFAHALEQVGWLIANGDTVTIPNFDRHNGKSAKRRANTAKRVAESRNRNAGNVTLSEQKALPEKRREEKRRLQEDPVVEASGITKTELQETPPDGPAPLAEADVMQFVMDWNALAETHSILTRYGQVTLNRFDREALESRVAAGTWSEDWSLFQQAVGANRVTSGAVTIKKLLQGDILDAVASSERRSAPKATTASSRPRWTPESVTEARPFADLHPDDLRSRREGVQAGVNRLERQEELSEKDQRILEGGRKRLKEFDAELQFRRQRAARQEAVDE